jgi:hypothetical protein
LEAECLDPGHQDVAHGENAGDVHGSTVDVNDLFKQGEVRGIVGVHCLDDAGFRGVGRLGKGSGQRHEGGK